MRPKQKNEDRAQRELRDWIRQRGGSASVRELMLGPRRYRGSSDIAFAALNALKTAGYGDWSQQESNGRTVEAFVLHDAPTATRRPKSA